MIFIQTSSIREEFPIAFERISALYGSLLSIQKGFQQDVLAFLRFENAGKCFSLFSFSHTFVRKRKD